MKSAQLHGGGDAHDGFFLAMTVWRLGEREEARRRYQQGLEWMEKHKPQDAELGRLRAEAGALLGQPPPLPGPGNAAPP